MAGYLIAEEGPLAGLVVRFEEGEEWTLGRDPDEVSILLEDPMVSRKHVICKLTAEGYILESLSSVNPVTQNGKVLTDPVLLREGDILQIGSTFFRFTEKTPQETESLDEILPIADKDTFEEREALSSVSIETGGDVRWLLKVISGPNAGAEFAMQRSSTYILGKDPNLCDVVFQDLSVSRQHARLTVDEENHVFIEDLGSRNGVLLNGEILSEKKQLTSQDLVALGTTAFLMVDREQIHETIISPAAAPFPKMEEESAMAAAPMQPEVTYAEKKNWREIVVSKKHLVLAGVLALAVLAGFASVLALFNAETVVVSEADENKEIEKAIAGFSAVQFSFNPSNGKIFLVGHVLTSVEKQELFYKVQNLPFINGIEDNIVIDELVWENTNALLQMNPEWVGVSLSSAAPGKFVLRGYLTSLQQATALSDYINLNFPYLDRLENQIIIDSDLHMQIQSMLIGKGFTGVTYQLVDGELVLGGRVDHKQTSSFNDLVDKFHALRGVRVVKNYVIYTSSDTMQIDISQQYNVSGYSKKDEESLFVVINGRILSKGDVIDGMKITAIMPNSVLLEKDGIKFRINYNLQ
ncbi:MAG: type III secretion system inner membrane ring subunit SctD [Verrucomicrobia bacterium]|nr:type III secretion system inner membrane ring subunit SctD [Verrucomicrobiota bacterium]